ncbi:major capsid protein [Christiangramia sp.]|uniref:major capsid protein n=1 Tax=Christiangramia sp. TaxID=1931228 RepID=UPI00262CE8FF|nr:major capsid protein [Christiangramia sp.]
MAITLNQHKENITKRIIGRFSDSVAPKLGLSAWFPSTTTTSKQVSIEVQRNRALIAADVKRGTSGNLNTFGKDTEKIYVPPFFKEKFDLAALDVYERTFGQGMNPGMNEYRSMLDTANEKLESLRYKIDRSKELQRSQVLQTGIVTMKNGDAIDFKRKASSIVDLGVGNYWADAGTDPFADLAEGVKFIRQEGKSGSRSYDCIMGASVVAAFLNNAKVKESADFRHIKVLEIGTTMFEEVTGLNFHGRISLKNGNIDIWTYDDYYENADGSNSEYIDEKNVVLLPRDFKGKQAHAGVPAIIRDTQNAEFPEWIRTVATEYYIHNYVDPEAAAHMFAILSASLAVPFSVDRVWTAKVLA